MASFFKFQSISILIIIDGIQEFIVFLLLLMCLCVYFNQLPTSNCNIYIINWQPGIYIYLRLFQVVSYPYSFRLFIMYVL